MSEVQKREKDIYDRDIVYKAHHIGGQDLLLLWDFQLFALSKFKVGKTEKKTIYPGNENKYRKWMINPNLKIKNK